MIDALKRNWPVLVLAPVIIGLGIALHFMVFEAMLDRALDERELECPPLGQTHTWTPDSRYVPIGDEPPNGGGGW